MRRFAIVLAIIAIIAALSVIAAPWLLSSDIVKQRIASRIEELTGLKTVLKGTPKLSLFPYLEIKLRDVIIANLSARKHGRGTRLPRRIQQPLS